MNTRTLFRSGEGGYHTYRIPVLLALPGKILIAFCEGRMHSAGDAGRIDVLARISRDGGQSFSPARVIASDGRHTVGNPCAVHDRDTGEIFLFMNGNDADGTEPLVRANKANRRIYLSRSADNGENWTPLADITDGLMEPGWTWHACGPNHALQTRSGRLVIPCNHHVYDPETNGSGRIASHVILSDDHGATLRNGGSTSQATTENAIVELSTGALYMTTRLLDRSGFRAHALSPDGGETWSDAVPDREITDPLQYGCQGSVAELRAGVYALSNPARQDSRAELTIRLSEDDCQSWAYKRILFKGKAAYSDLAAIGGERIACAYECGDLSPYERIDLCIFSEQWVRGEGCDQ
jgi:sialidase-1